MSDTYKLQLRHGAESKNFSTRDEVLEHINGKLTFGGTSLLPYEPVLFFYGADDAKNAIIMVGLPEGKTQNGQSYFIVDTADLKKQIEAIDEKYEDKIESLEQKDDEILAVVEKEIEDRIAAVEEEANAREEKDAELEQAITDEIKERKEKDEEFQNAIDFTKADLMSVIEACGLIYNEKMAEDRVSYTPDMHDEVIRDAKDITEAIDKVSKFATKLGESLKVSVENTDTVDLTLEPNTKDGGNTLKANVNIAGTEGFSKKNYDNNIIGKTVEGLYASVSIEPSAKNPNILIFKTSGYIDGQFKVDAFETEVQLKAYEGDNGNKTGIAVSVDENKNVISAELKLASENTNILKLEDGEYIVEGTAKNIKYKDTTVFNALNTQSKSIEEIENAIDFVKAFEVKGDESDTTVVDVTKSQKGDFTVSSNVKLSNDKSIIISDGGLKADVSASFKRGTSTLLINVGKNEYAIDLSELAVSTLKDAKYDATNELLVLEFYVGDTTKTVSISVTNLIHDVEVDDSSTIDMTLTPHTGGPNHISAELRVDKSHSDNILTVNTNGAYVSKSHITDAVKAEADERKDSYDKLKEKLDSVSDSVEDNKDAIAKEAATARAAEKANADAIAKEISDARAAEQTNAKQIEKNAKAIAENTTAIGDEVTRASKTEQINANAIIAEENRAKAAETKNGNAISSEIDRAIAKEGDLLEKIGDNTESIKANTKDIADEVKRSTAVENEIKASVEANANAVKTEENRAMAAEAVNKALTEKESERAKAAENVLSEQIKTNSAEIVNTNTFVGNVNKALGEEITRAKAAEGVNATAIKAEETRAMAAEAANKALIGTESERAKAAEGVNATAIKAEENRAIEKENDLLEKITANATDIKSLSTEVGNIELKKIDDLSYALYVNGTKHGELVIPKDQFLKSVNYNPTNKELVFVFNTSTGEITTNVSIADLVDTYEAGNGLVLNGNTFSIDGTVALKSNVEESIKVEVDRAKAAEAELLTNINRIDKATQDNTNSISSLSEKLTAEITRSANTDDEIKGLITAEKERAIQVEKGITENASEINTIKKGLSDEILRATNAETAINGSIDKEILRATNAETAISNSVTEEVNRAKIAEAANKELIEAETKRAEKREDEIVTSVGTKAESSDVFTKVEVNEKLAEYSKTTDIDKKLAEKANVSDLTLSYATKEELRDLENSAAKKTDVNAADDALSKRIETNKSALDNIDITYNSATSELTYVDSDGTANVYKLYSGSLIKDGTFDTDSNSIVLTIENAGRESNITIPVTQLLSDVDKRITDNSDEIKSINNAISKLAKSWKTTDSSTISFTKSTVGEEDVLTGKVRVASSNKQAIQTVGDGLYVSNDLEDFTCVFGSSGTISAQTAVSTLLESSTSMKKDIQDIENNVTNNASKIEKLDNRVTANESNIKTINKDVEQIKTDVTSLKKDVEQSKIDVAALKQTVESAVNKVNTLEAKVINIDTKVSELSNEITTLKETYDTKINNLEQTTQSLQTVLNKIVGEGGGNVSIPGLAAEIEKIRVATGYDTYGNGKDNMSNRLDAIEDSVGGDITNEINDIKGNIIGSKDNPTEGSVWYELNNMIDAGTF